MKYYITDINPEPWTTPTAGRAGHGIILSKSEALNAYQEAIKEAFEETYPKARKYPKGIPLDITFTFRRQLVVYEKDEGGKGHKNRVDATNCQKALEDALQGVLFANDRDVQTISSTLYQDHDVDPAIVIEISEAVGIRRKLGHLNHELDDITTARRAAMVSSETSDRATLVEGVF